MTTDTYSQLVNYADCTSNLEGRLTDKLKSYTSDAIPTAFGNRGRVVCVVLKDGGGKDDASSPHPLFKISLVSGQ